ncbi:hypothetical protein ACIA8R_02755 [Nonomuraea sp. NPDC051191]|uniref:hypothetical protein n=1 Tax=Nonomuraea sp. NPDC051191 TaxID=3364372 RepID=UPI00379D69E9
MRAAPWMILIGPAATGKSTLGEDMASPTGTLATTVLHTDGDPPARTLARLLTSCRTGYRSEP